MKRWVLPLWYHRHRWSKREREAAWTVAVIVLACVVIAALLASGAGREG